jgi:hypothetical protein
MMAGRDAGHGLFEPDRGLHAERGVAPVGVVVIDPGRHLDSGLGFAGEVFQPAQLELHRGVPRFDHRVV